MAVAWLRTAERRRAAALIALGADAAIALQMTSASKAVDARAALDTVLLVRLGGQGHVLRLTSSAVVLAGGLVSMATCVLAGSSQRQRREPPGWARAA